MSRPVISLGDVLRACHALEPRDAATRRAILELLGLAADPDVPAPAGGIGAWKPSSTEQVSRAQRRASQRRAAPEPTDRPIARMPAAAAGTRGRATVATHEGPRGEGFSKPDWIDDGAALHELEGGGEPPPPPELFGRVKRRGILAAAAATEAMEGDLDIEAIIDTLASGAALSRLPRLPIRTTRLGVQVLVDRGQGMIPFRDDQQLVLRALDELLPDDRFDVWHFEGCPSRGVRAPGVRGRGGLEPWGPPPPGVPVIVITDLGIGGPLIDDARSTPGEWIRFAERARGGGHPLIGLVPYEATRWPPRVARDMTLLHWSERTTAGEVRRAMRDGSRRRR